jgi:iron complex outermembrane receptor protein
VQRRTGSTFRRFAAAPTLDLYAPVYFQSIAEPPVYQDNDDKQFQVGLYVQDQIKIEKWILTLGARQDWAANETTNNRTATTTKTDDSAFTGRIGLGYAFENGITPYVSFAQSFEPQSGVDFAGRNFEPTTGEQYEAGIKYDVPNHNAFLTLSAFELTQENLLTTDPDHPGFSVQTGEIRSRGIELEAVASLESGWDVIASYTYVDQEVTKSNTNELGKRRAGIPRHSASLWGSYNFDTGWLHGVKVGTGVRYVSSSAGDNLNTFDVPSYMLFDASLSYDMAALGTQFDGWNASINATNLTDKTYVASCGSSIGCYYGVGRSVIARLKYSW